MDTPLFASRLARLPVLATDGGEVGRVADLVVGPAREGPPALHGIVVAVPGRHIFVGVGRIAALAPDGVRLRDAAVNLRRFSARPSERLVLADLLDRPLADGWRVNDVALAPAGGRVPGWVVVGVNAARGRRLPGRRPRTRDESWEVLQPLLAPPQDEEVLRDTHPFEVAARLVTLSPAARRDVVAGLDDHQLADVLEELPEALSAELLAGVGRTRAADVLEAMEPDDAADLLGEVDASVRGSLLAAMDPSEADPLRRLLAYGSTTAGGLMTPEPVALLATATVAEALARLGDPDLPAALAGQVFVVDPPTETPTGPLRGVCALPRLLRERPGTPLGVLARPVEARVAPDASHRDVARAFAAYDLLAAPVCDEAGRLHGVVTVDDVLDSLLPSGWRTP